MASPFPGMDPYLEDSEIWPGFHASLGVELKRQLNQRIGPKYYADVEVQSEPYSINIDTVNNNPIRPDVSVFQPLDSPSELAGTTAITIAPAPLVRPVGTQPRLRAVRVFTISTSQLVTSLEILSPYNKRASEGLSQYRDKRHRILASRVHLIELDLLRGGARPGSEVADEPVEAEYILLVNRASGQRVSEIWPVALNEPLPVLPVPLAPPDPDVALDLSAAIRAVYADSRYDTRINYRRPVPPPPLRPVMAEWFEGWRQTQEKFRG
jgi:hypothetical protein